MAPTDFLDAPPDSAELTDYDRSHLKVYMRVLDAAVDGDLQLFAAADDAAKQPPHRGTM